MSVHKQPNGRFRARLKSGRTNVASKTFDTKREAEQWLARERAALVRGIDPRAGQQRVRALLGPWLASRRASVSANTYRIDADLERVLPASLLALQVAAVTDREVARCFEHWIGRGLSERTAVRYRASLSAFFGLVCARAVRPRQSRHRRTRTPPVDRARRRCRRSPRSSSKRPTADWQQQNARLAESFSCSAGQVCDGARPAPSESRT